MSNINIIKNFENDITTNNCKLVYISKSVIDTATRKLIENINNIDNVFIAFREALYTEIVKSFNEQGVFVYEKYPANTHIKNDTIIQLERINTYFPTGHLNDCISSEFAVRYGFNIDSLHYLNYLCQPLDNLPALNTLIIYDYFFLGNLIFKIKPIKHNFSISLKYEYPLNILGYNFNTNTENKTYLLGLLGIRINPNYLKKAFADLIKKCNCNRLLEVKPSFPGFPPYFICNKCGKIYICDCFNGYVEDREIPNYFKGKVNIKSNICSYCTLQKPLFEYSPSGSSKFVKYYYPYIQLCTKKYPKLTYDEAENIVRKYFGYPPKRKRK